MEPTTRSRRGLVLFIVFVAMLGAAYVFGRIQGMAGTKAAEAEREKCLVEVRSLESKVTAKNAALQRVSARRRLHLAIEALDQRNFGIAQQHLRAAGSLLRAAQPNAGSDLGRIGAELGQLQVSAAPNVADQRARLQSIAVRFDQLLPLTN